MANADETPETPPTVPPDAGPQPSPTDREANLKARMWAMVCHLAGFAGLLPIMPAFGSVLGPLIVWMIKKDEYSFVDEQGKEAVNFQLTMVIYGVVSAFLLLTCIGIVLLPVVILVDMVLMVIAAIKADDGYHYRYPYPLIIRFIK